ncbi:DUF935 domain-containing protein [Candidatus Erwinia dacicola]|uniref:DUF935 domain-containing protein n=1 Tax=Candidatus Erwinia dacicola TaxID=252393 RepID=A0A1E7Z220_9GAMM|nr:DUF935 domain-containing protein [Candidatus Erwinia dacicola]OFC62826.1 hypothetical protein BBW68_01355 [Candidatus Erwinia dacicola]RAP70812.1 hypothetical protein ACZ87_02384 [Candidatus Erwinia dacicola]
MPRGLWVSPNEFVSFAEPDKTLTEQIASRSRSIDFFGLGMYLPNPDPVLKSQGRDIRIYRELRTDPLVGGCIRRRKAAVKSLERGLERGQATERVFSFVNDMLDDLDISRIIGEMTDAVLYGYQPCEIMWGRSVKSWAVTDIVGKPPEWFQFDNDNLLRFRAKDAGLEGELVPLNKFVVPRQDATYDNPYGFPDLSMCFWPVTFKKGGMKFWVRFAEKFGSPWVIGKHPRGTAQGEIDLLLDSMEAMVEDAVAAIPDDSSIEIKEAAGKADSSDIYQNLITLARSEISIALLGQNQTTEANSNRASAQAGLEVTSDIRDADAEIVESAVNQVIRQVVALNFGNVASPVWRMWEQGTVDDLQASRDEKLSRAGVVFTPQYFKREYQLQDGDIDETPPSERQKNNILPLSFAEAIDADIQAQQDLDDALDILMNGGSLNGVFEPVLAPLFKQVEGGVNPPELLGVLAELYPQMNADDLQERLARILFVSTLWGRLHERDHG